MSIGLDRNRTRVGFCVPGHQKQLFCHEILNGRIMGGKLCLSAGDACCLLPPVELLCNECGLTGIYRAEQLVHAFDRIDTVPYDPFMHIGNTPVSPKEREAMASEWCWTAAIIDADYSYVGNGALVGLRWVLTAAELVRDRDVTTLRVFLGAHNMRSMLDDRSQQVKIDRVEINGTLALLHTEKIAQCVNERICKACLPDADAPPLGISNCIGAGWGRSHGAAKEPNMMLGQVRLREADCRGGIEQALDNSTFCSASMIGDYGFCDDRGAPIVCYNGRTRRYQLVGINLASRCERKGSDLHARISAYRAWLNATMTSVVDGDDDELIGRGAISVA